MDAITNPVDELLAKINTAVAAANEAEKIVETAVKTAETAKTELVSRSKAVGLLLLEARKLHPEREDWKAFLERVHGLKESRAYDLMRLADGRVTDEELKEDARFRKQKSRAGKKKAPRPTPTPRPIPKPVSDSVTNPDVTESAKAEAEKRQEEREAENEATRSARALAEFAFACRTWLPKMIEADRRKAYELVAELTSDKAEAA